jgi:hypothetical protein
MAQRMETVAPAGAVMLSESTARLVEHIVMLAVPLIGAVESVEADSFTLATPSRPSNPALPQQGHHHEGCVADRRSHTRGGTPKLPERGRRCPDATDVLCVNHRRSSVYVIAERWPAFGRAPQWELSLAFGGTIPVARYCNLAGSARYYLAIPMLTAASSLLRP